jgi:hypothetical protein
MTRVFSRIVRCVLIIGIYLAVMTDGSLAAVTPVAEVSENEMGELSQYQSPPGSGPSTTLLIAAPITESVTATAPTSASVSVRTHT